jgi:hypothetical protein
LSFLLKHGGNDYEREIDVDCVLKSFSLDELGSQARRGDPLAQYSLAVALLQPECQSSRRARSLLSVATRGNLGELNARFSRSRSFPEADYMLAFIEFRCGGDVIKGRSHLIKAWEGGLALAHVFLTGQVQPPDQ